MARSCGDCRSAGAKHTLSSMPIRVCHPTGYGLVPVIEEVAFARIDVRLSQCLLQMADGTSQRRIRISPKGVRLSGFSCFDTPPSSSLILPFSWLRQMFACRYVKVAWR